MTDEVLEAPGRAIWASLSPADVAEMMAGAGFPWWIAGGHAIDHAVGRALRPHDDIDVLVLRRDQRAVQAFLEGWDLWATDPPGSLRPWRRGEVLPSHVTGVWCRRPADDRWQLELLLDDGDDQRWRSRRCAAVTRPLVQLGSRDGAGIPFLATEIQLFYKAKSPRPKDETDFSGVLPHLEASRRQWLREAIVTAYGADHPWLARLIA